MKRSSIIITMPTERADAFLKLVEGFGTVLPEGEDITVDVQPIAEPEKAKGKKPTVQYRAVAGSEALEAIGGHTVQGIIFKYLLTNGPCTERQIREALTYTRKATESGVDKLKTKGVVVSEPIPVGGKA